MIIHLNNNLKKNNFKIVLVISPQLLDFTEGNHDSVSNFYKQIGRKVHYIDLFDKFKKKNLKNLISKIYM